MNEFVPAAKAASTPVEPNSCSLEDARIMVGWLLRIMIEGPAHEFDREMAFHAAKQFLGIEETTQ